MKRSTLAQATILQTEVLILNAEYKCGAVTYSDYVTQLTSLKRQIRAL